MNQAHSYREKTVRVCRLLLRKRQEDGENEYSRAYKI